MSEDDIARTMPKGGRKGGTQFPQLSLKKAEEYAKKLVSKTHTGPQPDSIILKGVFGNQGSDGKIRASALKQYGLLEGTADAYTASDLAKALTAAPQDETQVHLRAAFLRSSVYKTLFDTFVGDKISKAKISQQAASLNVHPDSVAKAAQLFVEGAAHAGLATIDGEEIEIFRADPCPAVVHTPTAGESDNTRENGEDAESESDNESDDTDKDDSARRGKAPIRAVATVAIKVDPSTHTDDLEKQLKLLRKFGVI